jgi:hypothetical protein
MAGIHAGAIDKPEGGCADQPYERGYLIRRDKFNKQCERIEKGQKEGQPADERKGKALPTGA